MHHRNFSIANLAHRRISARSSGDRRRYNRIRNNGIEPQSFRTKFFASLLLQSLEQFVKRGRGKNTVELGAVVVYEADVFNQHIIDFPASVSRMKLILIVDRNLLSLVNNLG